MKPFVPLLFILFTLNSCSTFKSGLTIPANNTFLLGELNDENYNAEIINPSDFTVLLKTIDKESGVVREIFGLAPKEKISLFIRRDETVHFENENGVDVRIDVTLSKEVEGMRYIENK